MTPSLLILTMALRPDGAMRAAASVAAAPSPWPVEHRLVWHVGPPDPGRERVAARITQALAGLPPTVWVVAVDDDNLLHPALPETLARVASGVVLFGQRRPDFGGYIPPMLPPTPGRVDGGQVAIRGDLAGLEPWRAGAMGDGEYLAALYARTAPLWRCVDEPLTYHNAQRWM